jgi:hypothetical protein
MNPKNKDTVQLKHSAKADPAFAGMEGAFSTNRLTLPPAIAQELKEAGYDHRFVNETEFRQNHFMHQSGWLPYHLKNQRAMSSVDGIDSSGAFRRGDLILAVRPIEMSQAHRAKINERTQRQSGKAMTKQKTEEFKQVIKDQGLSKYTKIDSDEE